MIGAEAIRDLLAAHRPRQDRRRPARRAEAERRPKLKPKKLSSA
jgi:hypothetical protein